MFKTDKARKIFSELLDKNYDAKFEKNPVKKWDMLKEVGKLTIALKEEMGEAAYEDFIRTGQKMFASKA